MKIEVQFLDDNKVVSKGLKKLKGDDDAKWESLIQYLNKKLKVENALESYEIILVNHNNRNDIIDDVKSLKSTCIYILSD